MAENQLIEDLARDFIRLAAPQELPLFRANSAAFFQDPQKALHGQTGKDEILGFGAAEAAPFITPIVMAVLAEVTRYLAAELQKALKTEGAAAINDLVKNFFIRFRAQDSKIPPLSRAQLAQVRQLALEHAGRMKLSEDKALLLADSIVGSLVTSG